MEVLDIINDNDEVVGSAPREEIYAKLLPHRIVHVLIFNTKGDMLLQLRSRKVKFGPLHWSTAVGGHVSAGETYEQAALREFKEELGATVPIRLAFTDWYVAQGRPKKRLATFTTVFEGKFDIDTDAVERVEYLGMDAIKRMISSGEKFHPELLFLLKNHF